MRWPRNSAEKRAWSVPSGNPRIGKGIRLTLPPNKAHPGEGFILLPGLNLHPSRLEALGDLLRGEGLPVFTPESIPEINLRNASRSPPPVVAPPGREAPATLSGAEFRYREWLGALDRTAREMDELYPGISLSLCGFSLGGLLGMAWSVERGIPFKRALLVAPAFRIKQGHGLTIDLLGRLLPDGLPIPSITPRRYRHHSTIPVADYRAMVKLEQRFSGKLERWLRGEGTPPPRMLIAYSPKDELIDTEIFPRLRNAVAGRKPGPNGGEEFPEGRIVLHPLHPRPRRRYPAHLVIDPESLGESQWNAFAGDVRNWLAARAVKPEPMELRS